MISLWYCLLNFHSSPNCVAVDVEIVAVNSTLDWYSLLNFGRANFRCLKPNRNRTFNKTHEYLQAKEGEREKKMHRQRMWRKNKIARRTDKHAKATSQQQRRNEHIFLNERIWLMLHVCRSFLTNRMKKKVRMGAQSHDEWEWVMQ